MSGLDPIFHASTPLNDEIDFLLGQQRHILNGKWGKAIPSAFEIYRSVTDSIVILGSTKDPECYLCVSVAGEIDRQVWYTVAIVDRKRRLIKTAYNTLTYGQKGQKLWPMAV